jgi:hypothetical protein
LVLVVDRGKGVRSCFCYVLKHFLIRTHQYVFPDPLVCITSVQANRETRRETRFLDKGVPVSRRASKATSLSEVAGQPKRGNIGVTF